MNFFILSLLGKFLRIENKYSIENYMSAGGQTNRKDDVPTEMFDLALKKIKVFDNYGSN